MIFIIVAESYGQFQKFVRSHFPYLSAGRKIEQYFTYIITKEDINKILGLERNQPILYIGGHYHLVRTMVKERFFVEIRIAEEE